MDHALVTREQVPMAIPYCNIREALEQEAEGTWQGPDSARQNFLV